RLVFDDGHDTGLYSWRWFRDMIENRDEKWSAYLDALAAKGLSRFTS
ncbi:MAG: gamma-butyrobetaine hydroxylase-like domain-containing protein, partial [Alphaproteobacteria bacterium]